MLTVSAQPPALKRDSINFAPDETKALVSAYQSLPKWMLIAKYSDSVAYHYSQVVKNDTIKLKGCEDLSAQKDVLANSQTKQADQLQKDLDKSNKWRSFWRGTTEAVAIVAGVVITYLSIKP